MSSHSRTFQPSDDLPRRIGGPSTLSMPDDWTMSTPWKRAQEAITAEAVVTEGDTGYFGVIYQPSSSRRGSAAQ